MLQLPKLHLSIAHSRHADVLFAPFMTDRTRRSGSDGGGKRARLRCLSVDEKKLRGPLESPAKPKERRPIAWTGRDMPRAQIVGRFLLSRSAQEQRWDGVRYDYLFSLVKRQRRANARILVGTKTRELDAPSLYLAPTPAVDTENTDGLINENIRTGGNSAE